MTERVKPIPDGFHTLTPHLVVRDAARAIEFYQQAFGAHVARVHRTPDGGIMHAELKIGDSMIMLSDEFPSMNVLSPESRGGSSTTIHIYIENVDEAFDRAVAAGCSVTFPLADQFWGDRYGAVVDPFGHNWSLATHTRDLSEEEIERAGKAIFSDMARQAQKAT